MDDNNGIELIKVHTEQVHTDDGFIVDNDNVDIDIELISFGCTSDTLFL